MTPSELAFLTIGLLLGAAVGAALVVVLGTRPNRREIRVTVTHGAVPGRSETLSQGALVTRASEPAAGGPGDRRMTDREPGASPSIPGGWAPEMRPAAAPGMTPSLPPDRTIVPSFATTVGIAIHPEPDTELSDLRLRTAQGMPLERMLRGDHRAMVEAVDAIAGTDGPQRRSWEVLLGGLVEVLGAISVRESVIDFPMGTAFWDSFTVEQCRRFVAALASMGYRYDGVAGWQDGRVPAYRDMTRAMADIGLEPRRVRAWPNSTEIASLFVGARPAPEELLAAAGPEYTAGDMRSLVGEHANNLADLWLAWEVARPVLIEGVPAAAAQIPHPEHVRPS